MYNTQEFIELVISCQWIEFLIVYFLLVTGRLHPERGFVVLTRYYRCYSLETKINLFLWEMKLRRKLSEWREGRLMRYRSGGYPAIQRGKAGLPASLKPFGIVQATHKTH